MTVNFEEGVSGILQGESWLGVVESTGHVLKMLQFENWSLIETI